MPRRSRKSDRDMEERYWDRYYEMRQQEEEDRMWDEYYEEREEEERRARRVLPPLPREPRAGPWRYEVTFLRRKLDDVEAAVGIPAKVEQTRLMMASMLDFRAFLAATPKFRQAVVKKIAEFRADPKAADLKDILQRVSDMIDGLATRTDFKA